MAFRSGCKLSNLFESAVAAAGTRSDFHDRTEFKVRITAASLCCELRLRQNTGNYDASVALPQKSSMLTRCNNEDNLQTVTLEHFFPPGGIGLTQPKGP